MKLLIDSLEVPAPVEWHEGMLLAPQHLQQLSTRFEFLLQQAAVSSSLPAWGVRRLRIDLDRLTGGTFRLLEADVILPDGFQFQVTVGDGLEVDIKPAAALLHGQPFYVYVTVPARPALETQSELARFRSVEQGPVRDTTGESEISLPVLRPRAALWAGGELPARFTGVPVARVAELDGLFTLASYEPPTPELPMTSPLRTECAAVVRLLREKALFIAEKLQSGTFAGDLGELWQARMQLRSLSAGLPGLEAMLALESLHPQQLYLRFCDLAGQLAALSYSQIPPQFAPYQHLDPAAGLRPLCEFAQRALSEGISEKWQRIRLLEVDGEFRAPADARLEAILASCEQAAGTELVLGLKGQAGSDPAALKRWCQEAVIAPAGALDELLDTRTLGWGRHAAGSLPGLIAPAGMTLFVLETGRDSVRAGGALTVQGTPGLESSPVEAVLYISLPDYGRRN